MSNLTVYDLNIQYVVPEEENKAPANIAQVTLWEMVEVWSRLRELTYSIIDAIWSVSRDDFVKEKWDPYNLTHIEDKVVEFLITHKVISGYLSKLKKQIENIYSPLLMAQWINEKKIEIDLWNWNKWEIIIKQNVSEKVKFNYSLTTDLLRSKLDLNKNVDFDKYVKYLETEAWFNIARTNLEKILKKNGFLEEDIVKVLGDFVFTETGTRAAIELPIVWNFDPNKRIVFVTDDAFVNYDNGTKWMNLYDILVAYYNLNLVINEKDLWSRFYVSKIDRLLKDEAFIGEVNYAFQNIRMKQIETIKVKFNGLFKDKNGNNIDIVEHLKTFFHLSAEDINSFVNSKKRNRIDLPKYILESLNNEEHDGLIPIYKVIETKVEVK